MEAERSIIGPVGVFVALLGLLLSYMACLHGTELDQKSLAAFGFWSLASIFLAFALDWLFKFVLILLILFVGALWWTENPAFDTATAQAKDLRLAICEKITYEVEGVPYKEWIC